MTNWMMRLRSRRSFLAAMVGASVVAVTAACGGKNGSTAVGGKVNVGSVTDVRASLASQQYVRSTEGRLFLLPATDNAVIAVSWQCTHSGCTLPPPGEKGGNFACPCHGSTFDGKTGIRLSGPANRPLDYMHAVVESGNVIVDTSQVFTRTAFEAEQTAPLT
jgi:cytochrome b6-f complex iron-sulfur subunit